MTKLRKTHTVISMGSEKNQWVKPVTNSALRICEQAKQNEMRDSVHFTESKTAAHPSSR